MAKLKALEAEALRRLQEQQAQAQTGQGASQNLPPVNNTEEQLIGNPIKQPMPITDTAKSEDYVKKIKGNSGVSATAQKMVEQYRQNIRAIDYEIIKELNDLFMGLF